MEVNPAIIPHPESATLRALKGKVSEPKTVVSHKPGFAGQDVTVRLVEEGSGMIGLENKEDNKEWAGIFNHIVTTARVASFLAKELRDVGETVDPERVLNIVLLSHAGRRKWDESRWYADNTRSATQATKEGDQPLTNEILREAHITEDIMDAVDAHSAGALYPIDKIDTWEKKIATYADQRISQGVMSLDDRYKEHLEKSVAQGRLTKEQLDAIFDLAKRNEQEIFSKLTFSPQDISDDFPPQPMWEKYIRRLYVQDAERGIFKQLSEMHAKLEKGEITQDEIEKEFPDTTWWGKYVKELYDRRHGVPLTQRVGKQIGIGRAIDFYMKFEEPINNVKTV